MIKISDKLFKQHVLENTITPCQDSPQFLAYIILLQKYPNLTYWSMDGYSCDALADYDKNIVWNRDEVIDWSTKEVMKAFIALHRLILKRLNAEIGDKFEIEVL